MDWVHNTQGSLKVLLNLLFIKTTKHVLVPKVGGLTHLFFSVQLAP